MTTYCVWFDNFMQELFALEKYEFDKLDNFKKNLENEKNTIHVVEATCLKDAFDKYKEKQEITPVLSHLLH